ncbi:MAG: sulfatase-like hydrolase/transferase [Bacteroidetes bacterium]|jgi:arylsulfatase A-like enzyme|nr:sulfatase-like hydrolase/transferase [Bacteroidota bacterium]MBT4410169.1 sulfatase-like hydrolase/transferase [Bacteroidota bacterium]MBT5424542.1 sulfatase-like hydrolase/transferase [Bacteroidota bacterium]MBT7464690.1 sulfatase-like hydrolase/transferase [Bacteroidota bacterium]
MKNTSHLIALIILILIMMACQNNSKKLGQLEKPNILFLFTDDQRYNTVNALGNEGVVTPNMDKLSQSGVTFTHSYNMGAWHGAVCVASRAMLNTGLSVWRARDAESRFSELVANRQFWAQRMKDLGYETYFSGKWHVKADAQELFDNVVHVRPGMPNQTPAGYHRPRSISDSTWLPWDTIHGGFWKGGKHWSEVLADDAINFLEQAAEKEKPFFMYLAFNAPHDPRQSPKEFVDMYPIESQKLPESFIPEYPFKDSIGCSRNLRDEALAPFPRTEYAVKVNQLEYFALISHTDVQFGRILDALEKTGKSEETYVLYTADHGLAVGYNGLIGKQNMFDHSVRVPLILTGPGIPENAKRDQQVYLQDVFPTVIELAGGTAIKSNEFQSLLPMIRKSSESSKYDAIYGCYMNLQRMVRTEKYKLIVYPKIQELLLFDMVNDPLEMSDLSDDPAYAEILTEMKEKLTDQQLIMNDPLDLSEILGE